MRIHKATGLDGEFNEIAVRVPYEVPFTVVVAAKDAGAIGFSLTCPDSVYFIVLDLSCDAGLKLGGVERHFRYGAVRVQEVLPVQVLCRIELQFSLVRCKINIPVTGPWKGDVGTLGHGSEYVRFRENDGTVTVFKAVPAMVGANLKLLTVFIIQASVVEVSAVIHVKVGVPVGAVNCTDEAPDIFLRGFRRISVAALDNSGLGIHIQDDANGTAVLKVEVVTAFNQVHHLFCLYGGRIVVTYIALCGCTKVDFPVLVLNELELCVGRNIYTQSEDSVTFRVHLHGFVCLPFNKVAADIPFDIGIR